jgi:hypothetical protein
VTARTLVLNPAPLLVASWGVVGVLVLLAQALLRLTPVALEPLGDGMLTPLQAGCYAGWVILNGYLEGYRGFQRRFSPRVVARAVHLSQNPRPLFVLLAPLYCMSFFHATRRGKAAAWGILLMVVVLVTLVRYVPQPWRGIIDGGVVVGLAWGALAIVAFFVRALAGGAVDPPEDLPAGPAAG